MLLSLHKTSITWRTNDRSGLPTCQCSCMCLRLRLSVGACLVPAPCSTSHVPHVPTLLFRCCQCYVPGPDMSAMLHNITETAQLYGSIDTPHLLLSRSVTGHTLGGAWGTYVFSWHDDTNHQSRDCEEFPRSATPKCRTLLRDIGSTHRIQGDLWR